LNKTIVAALLALSFAAPAFAAPGDNPRRRVEFYDNAGTLHEMDNFNDPAILAMMMQHATKLAPGSIVVTQDGQVFVLQDFKMPTGQMLSDQLQHQ
jgi:hypothetical protein